MLFIGTIFDVKKKTHWVFEINFVKESIRLIKGNRVATKQALFLTIFLELSILVATKVISNIFIKQTFPFFIRIWPRNHCKSKTGQFFLKSRSVKWKYKKLFLLVCETSQIQWSEHIRYIFANMGIILNPYANGWCLKVCFKLMRLA